MKGLLKSFVYAGSGIITCIRQERNMRVHLVCMIYMYSYLLIYDFFEVSRTQVCDNFYRKRDSCHGRAVQHRYRSGR